MKIRSVITGDIRELNDDGARQLITAGIYEAVEESEPRPRKGKPPSSADQ